MKIIPQNICIVAEKSVARISFVNHMLVSTSFSICLQLQILQYHKSAA
ncbi:unnamed protein product [Chironomus riparius]|uniref:Uncharacterized protein n=1 Tax=Chironomus riparius TaxID=315576 RepID=A0A9N9WNZ8_9DIPT|nr:unnamed protein product [Chironomus riparius]